MDLGEGLAGTNMDSASCHLLVSVLAELSSLGVRNYSFSEERSNASIVVPNIDDLMHRFPI